MVEYTVEVHSTTVFTLEEISIRLIGTNGESEPQILHTFSLSSVYTSNVSCTKSVGTLLLVELKAKPSGFKYVFQEWFCAKLVVTTPEGEKVHFPCYQWLNSKKPVVSLRNDKATLRNEETNAALLRQRYQELAVMQRDFKWKKYHHKLPYIIDAETPSDLPHEARFSFTKNIEMKFNALAVLAELKVQSFMVGSESWESLEQLHSFLWYPTPKEYVRQHWKSDKFFGYQFLNGLNPLLIERCSKLPHNFPVTDDMVKSSLGRRHLDSEMKEGNIFLCDYKRLSGFEGNMINDRRQSLTAPLCLLYSTPKGNLIPLAIQLYQEPSEENPIFLPTDSKWDWLLAKTFVRSAEFHEHELNFHLLRTHLLAEVFSLATLRNLPSAHPLFKLLMPHTRYTFHINIMARHLLISEDGIFKRHTAIGRDDAVNTFLPRAVSSLTYSSLCLPDNIKERGLENIPNYYYRDDGLKFWDIIHKFVRGVLTCYYKTDGDVKEDPELQKWISDIFEYGFLKKDETGIPRSFSKVEEVVKFVTMVIFTVSAQHAAANNSQFDFGGWMPNLPTSLRLPPPKKKGESTETTFLQTLPDVTTTIHGLAVLFLLSKKSFDHYPLGVYTEDLFGDDEARRHISEFQEDLRKLTSEIDARNSDLKMPYDYLKPANVDNSVAL
ncbi:polyunsaturated fatty acid lipoxygenase ALOX15B-like isoform X2 [Colossoma macropomum]|nr:polyunsaturated fatty acid lipoxygenase ALOX15B-like isoform X2 [Colossoma macropomum]XP_036444292.1 polyunsaturated fatty acid lipoxygenase ALOX15B-like isoform X2 [Colossoma macropomum]